ncbi:MAG: hypothetical protein V4850_13745 [Myxococcota bacterium]
MSERGRPGKGQRWLMLASYLALAVVVIGPRTLLSADTVGGVGVDLPGTIWMHWWVRTTLEQLSLPITTDLLFYPDGKNFFNDTGANYIDAYLGVPLQWVFGVPGFIDPLGVVVLVGNALAMQALATDLTGGKHPMAAWAAAAAFELNPYAVQQLAEGRPTQAMVWFALLATRHLLRLPTGTWRDAVLFGLFTVLQGLTYWFMVYFLTLALLPVALWQLVRAPRVVAPRLALAIAVAVGLAAPFLLRIHAEIAAGHVGRLGVTDWAQGPAASPVRWKLTREMVLTASWLATFGLGVWTWRRAGPWLAGLVLVLAFSAGAQLDVTSPPVHNPFFITLWDHVPLLSRLGFPERVACMAFVLLAMCAAVGLARLDRVWAPLFVGVVLAEGLWRGGMPIPSTGYHIPDGNLRIRDLGGAVIYLPFGANEDAMVYQTLHGQPLFGGMGERERDLRPKGYEHRLENRFVVMLGGTMNDTEPPIAYRPADREAMTALFRWVWLDLRFSPPSWTAIGYDRDAKLRRLTAELGRPADYEPDTYALWDLHAPVPADAPGLGPTAVVTGHELDRLTNASMAPSNNNVTGFRPPPAP